MQSSEYSNIYIYIGIRNADFVWQPVKINP